MTEWLKVRAWKVRIPQKGIVGSNPAFSANKNTYLELLTIIVRSFSFCPKISIEKSSGTVLERGCEIKALEVII